MTDIIADIIKRLRASGDHEAADAIEQLRTEIEVLRAARSDIFTLFERLREELHDYGMLP